MDERFAQFFPKMHVKTDDAILNQRLAERLNAKVGDEILIRVEKPSLLSRDAPLSKVDDASVTIRLPVGAIVSDSDGGRFSLEANQIPPLTVFLPISAVQSAVSLPNRANIILLGDGRVSRPMPLKPCGSIGSLPTPVLNFAPCLKPNRSNSARIACFSIRLLAMPRSREMLAGKAF